MLETRIASLRIHIERVIRRIREFNILKSHSSIHHELLDVIEDIIIVDGLINITTYSTINFENTFMFIYFPCYIYVTFKLRMHRVEGSERNRNRIIRSI